MKGRWIVYSDAELAWLEANHALPIGDYHRQFNARFGRDVSAVNLHALRKRKGWRTGRTGKFEKGQEPPNKGKVCPEGQGGRHPNARRTQFQKGQRSGVAERLYKPIGTERLSQEGYRERKINDDFPTQSRWRAVHLIEWEALHGPLPEGYCLKCLSDDKQNADPSNWEAIPRAILPTLNGGRHKKRLAFDEAHPEVRPTIMAMAKIEHAVREKRKRGSA